MKNQSVVYYQPLLVELQYFQNIYSFLLNILRNEMLEFYKFILCAWKKRHFILTGKEKNTISNKKYFVAGSEAGDAERGTTKYYSAQTCWSIN